MPSLTSKMCTFTSGLSLQSVPDSVVSRAVLALRDLVGIALSEAPSPTTNQMLHVANRSGGRGHCVLPGRTERVTPFWGAAVMGTSTHHAELDDGHRGGHVHPGVTALPALLMDAQCRPTAGEDFLASVIAAYEASIRIGEAISPAAQYERGFHIPGLVGTLGATLSVARLRGLDAVSTEAAVGAAALGPLTPFAAFSAGAPVKDLYGGWPAAVGILGNDLAAEGLGGPASLLESPMGWLTTVGADPQAEGVANDLGQSWRILETYVKVHAACSFSHSAIDAAIDLFRPGAPVSEIDRVTVATHIFADRLDDQAPTTPQGARFSIPWLVAAALARGRVTPEESSDDALADPTLSDLARRIAVTSDEAATQRHLADDRVRPARVVVTYKDGTTRSARRDAGRGGPEDPLGDDQVFERYLHLMRGYRPAYARRLWQACEDIQEPDGVAHLIATLDQASRELVAS